ncbi:MAG: hypothetical protein ACI4V7_02510 [Succinivibrionaceae bacterium]
MINIAKKLEIVSYKEEQSKLEKIERVTYLCSFNKVKFVDDNNVIIDDKYSIVKVEGDNTHYILKNLNNFWHDYLRFSTIFDKAELKFIDDNKLYNIRIIEFIIYFKNIPLGNLAVKLAFENNAHDISKNFAKFLGCNANEISKLDEWN